MSARRPLFAPLFLLCVGIASIALAAGAAVREAAPFLNQGLRPAETAASLAAGALQPGLSRESYQLIVGDCVNTLHSLYMRTRPSDERDAVAGVCKHFAEQSVAVMPTFSFGWFALAAIESETDEDATEFNLALQRSQITGPGEQWIAESRVALAEQRFGDLTEASLRGHESDLRLLVQSRRGIASIAQRYVEDPAFRERITAIVETLPREAQQAFIAEVKGAAGAS